MKIILDTETTGTGPVDQVIELAIINADTAGVLFDRRMKPTVPIDPEAAGVHGIHENFLVGCSSWADYHSRILGILMRADVIMGYNSDFDFRMMKQTAEAFDCVWPFTSRFCRDLTVPYADIAKIEFNDYYGTWKWQKLGAACKQQGIDMSDLNLHGALGDCFATQRLYQKMEADFLAYWGNNGQN